MDPTLQKKLDRACEVLLGPGYSFTTELRQWAVPAAIKAVFRRRVMETHPDRARALGAPEEELNERFKAVNEAYHLLEAALTQPLVIPRQVERARRRPPSEPRRAGRGGPGPAGALRDHFYTGPLPRRVLRFGEYLYYSRQISWMTLIDAISRQRRGRPMVGQLAVQWHYLTEQEVSWLLASRRAEGAGATPFATYALNKGCLIPFQVFAVLGRQRRLQRRMGDLLVDSGHLTPAEAEAAEHARRAHNRTSTH